MLENEEDSQWRRKPKWGKYKTKLTLVVSFNKEIVARLNAQKINAFMFLRPISYDIILASMSHA